MCPAIDLGIGDVSGPDPSRACMKWNATGVRARPGER